MSQEEQNLIAACLAHDRLAQKTLYDRYKRAMYTLAYRITGNFETASEVLQDGFLQVFKGLENFRQESTLGAWIKTIMVRTAYKRLKTNVLTEELPPSRHHRDFIDIQQYENENIDWGHTMDAEYLEKAIQSLPEGFRTVFTLIEIEGYTHRETADMLSISEGTSKSQLFYAKKRLRAILSNDE
jgi:RNA polymerase sigma factor (sigma-70 family)